MAWLCTSDNCKVLLLVFVVFLAGYFMASNDASKVAKRAEHFQESDREYTRVDDAAAPVPTDAVQEVLAKIDQIYKDVYGEPVPADKMSLYFRSLGSPDFDQGAFKRRLHMERRAQFESLVKNVFVEVLKRPPTPTELDKYIGLYLDNHMRSQQDLEFILRMDVESVIKTEKVDKNLLFNEQSKEPHQDYEGYKTIISIFEQTLGRNPNTSELKFYYNMMVKDGVDQEKLKSILVSSREYDILKKNQSNEVHGELAANVTEKQLEMSINEMYNAVYYKYPDEATFKFLKAKFLSFNMNEEKFAIFLKKLKAVEAGEPTRSTQLPRVSQQIDDVAMQQTKTKSNQELFSEVVTQVPDVTGRLSYANAATVQPRDGNGIGESIGSTLMQQHPIDPPAVYDNHVSNQYDNDSRALPTIEPIHGFIDAIKCSQEFDKNKFENAQDMRQKTAGYSKEQCNFNAKKTKNYWNADDNLVLRPEFKWQVPMRRAPVCYATDAKNYDPSIQQSSLIGTLLDEAENTSVGSIMPKFEFRHLH